MPNILPVAGMMPHALVPGGTMPVTIAPPMVGGGLAAPPGMVMDNVSGFVLPPQSAPPPQPDGNPVNLVLRVR